MFLKICVKLEPYLVSLLWTSEHSYTFTLNMQPAYLTLSDQYGLFLLTIQSVLFSQNPLYSSCFLTVILNPLILSVSIGFKPHFSTLFSAWSMTVTHIGTSYSIFPVPTLVAWCICFFYSIIIKIKYLMQSNFYF